ncbi:SMI1/KNR4 family protein [Bernardetia sp. MNP-M8]|uniref:SMI1/KNR4 family protein n=1 Tax=Bernardetia sp. MNP-M8 TaxID=3127470 RepID=UPI0030CF4C57
MKEPVLPIKTIGETNWTTKLTIFLEEYDVEVVGLESLSSKFELPKLMDMYFRNFGGIDSHDFMYNLYTPNKFIKLSESSWSFVKDKFSLKEMDEYIVFAESPSNDPICFHKTNNSIYLFSHDPIKKAKVFEDFNQYLLYEIIELQKLMGDIEWSEEEEIEYKKENFRGKDIDYEFRYMKL